MALQGVDWVRFPPLPLLIRINMLYTGNPKYCWAWNRVYVKANGRIPCWCDAGEPYSIIHKSLEDNDFICDIVNSEEMRTMRTTILRKNEYYIDECKRCCCMADEKRGEHARFQTFDGDLFEIEAKRESALKILDRAVSKGYSDGFISNINEIQIEPSFPCNLRCPGCLQGKHLDPLSTEEPPYVLPLQWFKNIINSCIYNDVVVHRIAFVGRGEPTLNSSFPDMIRYAKDNTNIKMSMDTNATQPFKDAYTLLDLINCSVDGSNNNSYSKYRRGGTFDKTVKFMRDAVNNKLEHNRACKIRWKYILFDTNDSVLELNVAQTIAKALGIDELMFVITHAGGGDVKPSANFLTTEQVDNYIRSNTIFDNCCSSFAT